MSKVSERERIQALEAKLKQLKVQHQRREARARTVAAKKSRGDELLGAKICLIELPFSYTRRRVTTDRLQCVNESHSLPTPLAFTVSVSLPRAVLEKRLGGVFNLPAYCPNNRTMSFDGMRSCSIGQGV
jgi:hypothetical protein